MIISTSIMMQNDLYPPAFMCGVSSVHATVPSEPAQGLMRLKYYVISSYVR